MRRSVSPSPVQVVLSLIAPTIIFLTSNAIAAPVQSGSSAFAYVGNMSSISGFAVAPDGSAQPVPGSPVSGASLSVVGTPNYVFATDGTNIATYTVGAGGSLDQSSSVNGKAYDLDRQSSGVGGLSLSPDNRSLYTEEMYYDGANNVYLTWGVGSNGNLSYLAAPAMPPFATAGAFPFTYSGNGSFAYTWSICDKDGSVWGFSRRPDGTLRRMDAGAQPPPPQNGQGGSDCSQAVAASAAGYLAVVWNGGFCCGGPPVLVSYAIQSNGTLALVPGSEQYLTCNVTPMAFDPSGRYLALGCNGVQVYALGTGGQLTALGTPQQPTVPFGAVAWDSNSHVYAIPQSDWQSCQDGDAACGLYIFNSNSGVLTLAAGSPHTVSQPASLAVLPAQ